MLLACRLALFAHFAPLRAACDIAEPAQDLGYIASVHERVDAPRFRLYPRVVFRSLRAAFVPRLEPGKGELQAPLSG